MIDVDRSKVPQPGTVRQHVVILGAGASLAAFPSGDKNGRELPLMRNLIDVVGLSGLLDEAGLKGDRSDFEQVYSELATTGQHPNLVAQIDRAIFDFFAAMELPDEPTLYDHLVLSLRRKDVIATFNWDPFLWQALARNWQSGALPTTLFLHGNTAVSHCIEHRPIPVRPRGQLCPHCGKPMKEAKLLYPVTQKDYSSDPFIATNWNGLRQSLEGAYLFTIFGYGAPVTDTEAVGLLKGAWGDPYKRSQEQIEIIDTKDDAVLRETWDPFIHSHHYQTSKSFFESIIARNPRRSCEAMFTCMVDIAPIQGNPIPQICS